MADVLTRIVERKRSEVAARVFARGPVEPSTRSLKAALAKRGARFIMEVKRRSPSGHASRRSVEEAVAAYAPIADAVSVLTDEVDFGGSLDDLRFVRRHFDGPILAKDFVVDPLQVGEARAAGADAVLAMLSVLDDATAAQVMDAARRLAMDVVVEVHDELQLRRALTLGAEIVGINNRDLRTLKTDLSVTERLAEGVPHEVLLISESGVSSHADVKRLSPLVDAFLVGSSLMAAPDIGEAARALVHGRVKLCGLTREVDVASAARAGATHAGFIFVPRTPRAVTPGRAVSLTAAAREAGLKAVGVFRDEDDHVIVDIARELQLDAVQLHGGEDWAFIGRLKQRLVSTVEIWAAASVDGDAIEPERGADRIIFDTAIDGASGGTGTPFDWSLLRKHSGLETAFLAGGISPQNAAKAAAVGAYGLDVSSGLEVRPGEKDPDRIEALFQALRPASRGDR